MRYQVLARKDDREILKVLSKMLKIKEGDTIVLELKDGKVTIEKFDDSIPDSCKNLKPEEVQTRLLETVESVKNGKVYSEQEVWKMMEEIRIS